MNKIYKIGNKELEKISLIYGDKGEVIVGVSGAINSVANTVNQLLEALSDKEETKLTTGDFVKKDDKGKWVGCLGYEKEGIVVGTDPLKVIEETKQEECEHLKQKILHKLDGSTEETCRDCGKDMGGSKQELIIYNINI